MARFTTPHAQASKFCHSMAGPYMLSSTCSGVIDGLCLGRVPFYSPLKAILAVVFWNMFSEAISTMGPSRLESMSTHGRFQDVRQWSWILQLLL